MAPVPPRAEEPTVKVEEGDSDLAQYEREGWSVGFDVEFHGTGIQVVAVDGSESSFSSDEDDCESKNDSAESETEDPYAGYQRVPVNASDQADEGECSEEKHNVPSMETAFIVPGFVPPKVKSEFEKLMMSPPAYEHDRQKYVPNDIPLDEEKTVQIKKAMAGFTLQPNESFDTKDLLNLVQKIANE